MLKADEIRENLKNELNNQYDKTGNFFNVSYKYNDSIISAHMNTLQKPKMFEPKLKDKIQEHNAVDIPAVKGIGFEKQLKQSNIVNKQIYSMKELIESNPENMRTLIIDNNVMKAQMALVKKREWQDILFSDLNWYQSINMRAAIKKFFKINY